jgi:hypothetical protein
VGWSGSRVGEEKREGGRERERVEAREEEVAQPAAAGQGGSGGEMDRTGRDLKYGLSIYMGPYSPPLISIRPGLIFLWSKKAHHNPINCAPRPPERDSTACRRRLVETLLPSQIEQTLAPNSLPPIPQQQLVPNPILSPRRRLRPSSTPKPRTPSNPILSLQSTPL